jgi:hypothetical protein
MQKSLLKAVETYIKIIYLLKLKIMIALTSDSHKKEILKKITKIIIKEISIHIIVKYVALPPIAILALKIVSELIN